MAKASFPERAAHLSYVAPLIGLLLVQQLGTAPGALALIGVLVTGGLISAVTGLRWWRRERERVSWAALLGLAANLLFVGLVVLRLRAG